MSILDEIRKDLERTSWALEANENVVCCFTPRVGQFAPMCMIYERLGNTRRERDYHFDVVAEKGMPVLKIGDRKFTIQEFRANTLVLQEGGLAVRLKKVA